MGRGQLGRAPGFRAGGSDSAGRRDCERAEATRPGAGAPRGRGASWPGAGGLERAEGTWPGTGGSERAEATGLTGRSGSSGPDRRGRVPGPRAGGGGSAGSDGSARCASAWPGEVVRAGPVGPVRLGDFTWVGSFRSGPGDLVATRLRARFRTSPPHPNGSIRLHATAPPPRAGTNGPSGRSGASRSGPASAAAPCRSPGRPGRASRIPGVPSACRTAGSGGGSARGPARRGGCGPAGRSRRWGRSGAAAS